MNIYATTPPPPHRIWSASGDHGKSTGWHRPGAPPPTKQKSWLRRCRRHARIAIMMVAYHCHARRPNNRRAWSIHRTVSDIGPTVSENIQSIALASVAAGICWCYCCRCCCCCGCCCCCCCCCCCRTTVEISILIRSCVILGLNPVMPFLYF